jgi:type III secretion protein U
MAQKTHQPTRRRLREARKRGEVVFSADVASAATFVATVVALWLLGANAFSLLRELWRHATEAHLLADPPARIVQLILHAEAVLLWSTLPIAAIAGGAAIAACFFQVGGIAAWSKLKPDIKRLNPAGGMKRLFSTRNVVNLVKMVAKTLLLASLLLVVVRGFIGTALDLGHARPDAILAVGAHAVLVTFAWAALIYVVMAAVDYTHQRYEFMKEHRMSIDDLRREYKDAEGDPLNTGRRRLAHMEAIYASLADRVKTASAVIHSQRVAVALQYRGEKDLPRVIARGEGAVAAQIRRFAADALIPTELDAALADRLYDEVPVGQAIPRTLFDPVARLLRWAQGQDTPKL